MTDRPSGTVTFLFSDVEGSTQRWERHPDAMGAALARHDALMREAIEGRGGYVFKALGDAFCAAFATTPDAVAAAVAAQRALRAEDFRSVDGMPVRIALHSGHAEERGGDYFGTALNRAARLLAIGHGGQVLLSGTVADLLQDSMPAECALRDLGTHRLKDLARPERVHQLDAPGLIVVFPPPRSLETLPNNLPQQLTSFVGRDETLAEIEALLAQHRLVTLVGTGGAGKTRCALQAAADSLGDFADGVWLVELAPLPNPSLIADAVAQTLGVREMPNRALIDSVLAFLRDRQLLLVLDNCEHLVEGSREFAAAILRGCAGVRIIATSRESLKVGGERVCRIPSLAVPARTRIAAGEAATYGAVALFADRAVAANGDFALTDDNAPEIAEIVARLDGIPLAIELAAARMNVLSPTQLTQKLGERFRLLTGGDRSALPRQQTLAATIDWSYGLLEGRERTILARLAVFAGGWTLKAATVVSGGDGAFDEWEVLDAISSLADKSLILVETAGAEQRYDMLTSIREYALARLNESGEREATVAKHAAYFADRVRGLAPLAAELEDVEWRRSLAPDIDNLRAAIDWAIVRGCAPAIGLSLLAEMEWPQLIATPHEALSWFEEAARRADGSTDAHVRSRVLRHCVLLGWLVGRSLELLEQTSLRALDAARASGDANEIARALANVGACHRSAGRFEEADRAFAEAYREPERLSRIATNAVLRLWAVTDLQSGNVDRARHRFSEVARLERPGSEAHASALLNLGELHFAAGDTAAARAAARAARESYERLSSVYRVLVLANLGAYAIEAGDIAEARDALREALALQRISSSGWLITVLEHHALLAAILDEPERAALLVGFTERGYASRGDARQHTERRSYERLMRLLEDAYAAEELARRMRAGAGLSEEQALAHAAAIHDDIPNSAATPLNGE